MHLDLPRQRCQCTAGRCSLQERIGCGRPPGNEGRWSASRHQSDPCKLPRKPIPLRAPHDDRLACSDRRGVTRAQRGSRCRHQKAGGFDRSQLVTVVAVVRAPMDSSESPPVV